MNLRVDRVHSVNKLLRQYSLEHWEDIAAQVRSWVDDNAPQSVLHVTSYALLVHDLTDAEIIAFRITFSDSLPIKFV